MDKLSLDLNDLEVDSFKTSSEEEKGRGTVQGNSIPECGSLVQTCGYNCDDNTLAGCQSVVDPGCGGTAIDPGCGGGTAIDPGCGGGETAIDPGCGTF